MKTPEKKRVPFSDGNALKSPGLSRELKSLMLSSPDSSKKKPSRKILGENQAEAKENADARKRSRKSPRKVPEASPKKPVPVDDCLEISFDEDEYIPEKVGTDTEDEDDDVGFISDEDSDVSFEGVSRRTISKRGRHVKTNEGKISSQRKREFIDYMPDIWDVAVRVPFLSQFEFLSIEEDFEKWRTLREKVSCSPRNLFTHSFAES